MKYILICVNNFGICTGKTEIPISANEIEITKEQYNTIQCPCVFTLSSDNKIISWKQCEIPADLFPQQKIEKTPFELLQEENILLKDRILQLEVAEVNRRSKEIEQQILGENL